MTSDFTAPSVYECATSPAKAAERARIIAEWEAACPEIARDLPEAWALDEKWEAARRAREAQTRREAELPGRLKRAGVPLRALEAWRTPGESLALGHVRAFLPMDLTFCLLLGGPGAGKTVAAVEAVAFALRQDRTARFVRAAEVARLSNWGDDAERLRDDLHFAGLLVIDDLAAETITEQWLSVFHELIDERYESRRKTVITSNATRETLAKRYGARFADRMRHDGKAFECGEKSLRVRRTT